MYLNITDIYLLSNICINKNVFALKPHSGPRIDFMFCHRFVSDRICDKLVHKKKRVVHREVGFHLSVQRK